MKQAFRALAAVSLLGSAALSAAPAAAEGSREYFTARIAQSGAPAQLDPATRQYYAQVFAAIDKQDWAGAQALLAQRDGPLHSVVQAELYLAPKSPKVELP